MLSLVFKDLMVYAQFYWNQDYIAQNQCINRADPESTCHGKCQLAKSFKEDKEQEQKCPSPEKEKHAQVVFLNVEDVLFQNKSLELRSEVILGSFKSSYYFQFLNDIFHPPRLV